MSSIIKVTLYVHPKRVNHYDYGELLGHDDGIAWSSDGNADNAIGFERGRTVADALAKAAPYAAELTVLVGEPITRSVDHNTYGLVQTC